MYPGNLLPTPELAGIPTSPLPPLGAVVVFPSPSHRCMSSVSTPLPLSFSPSPTNSRPIRDAPPPPMAVRPGRCRCAPPPVGCLPLISAVAGLGRWIGPGPLSGLSTWWTCARGRGGLCPPCARPLCPLTCGAHVSAPAAPCRRQQLSFPLRK